MVSDRCTAFGYRLFLAGKSRRTYVSVLTFPPLCPLPLPSLRSVSAAAPRHPASGCARLATQLSKGGAFTVLFMVPDRCTAFGYRLFLAGMSWRTYVSVLTFPPLCPLPLPSLRSVSAAAPRHPASGCARLATQLSKGGAFTVLFMVPDRCTAFGYRLFLAGMSWRTYVSVPASPLFTFARFLLRCPGSPQAICAVRRAAPKKAPRPLPERHSHSSQRVMRAPSALSRASIWQ